MKQMKMGLKALEVLHIFATHVIIKCEGCSSNSVNFPPYLPALKLDSMDHGLADKTLCGDAIHHLGNHYDVHNLFGWSQAIPTKYLEKKIKFSLPVRADVTSSGRGNWKSSSRSLSLDFCR